MPRKENHHLECDRPDRSGTGEPGLSGFAAIFENQLGESSSQTVRIALGPIVELGRLFLSLIPSVTVLVGKGAEISSGFPTTSLILADKALAWYLARLIYGSSAELRAPGKTALHPVMLRSTFRSHAEADISFTEGPRSLMDNSEFAESFSLPRIANFTLDLTEPISKIKNRMSKGRRWAYRRFLSSKDSVYVISHERSDLKYFYQRMYIPHLRRRHGKTAYLTPFSRIEASFNRGGLIVIKKGSRRVAGMIFESDGHSAFTPYLAVLEGDETLLREGIAEALVFSFMDWSKKCGLRRWNYGGVKPFTKDGLFQFKNKTGMTLEAPRDRLILIRPARFTPGVLGFFACNPFVFLHDEAVKVLVVVTEGDMDVPRAEKLLKTHRVSGVDGIVVVSTNGFVGDVDGKRCRARPVEAMIDALKPTYPNGFALEFPCEGRSITRSQNTFKTQVI